MRTIISEIIQSEVKTTVPFIYVFSFSRPAVLPETVAMVKFAIDEVPLHQMNMFLTGSTCTAPITAF